MMQKGTCKHFNGAHNTHCLAGVCYRDVTTEPDNTLGIAFRKPCIRWEQSERKYGPLTAGQAAEYARRGTCERYEEPTPEELKADRAKVDAHFAKFKLALPLIERIKKEYKNSSWQGIERCPACGGNLHLTHSSYNGHVWGKCETEGCLSWME